MTKLDSLNLILEARLKSLASTEIILHTPCENACDSLTHIATCQMLAALNVGYSLYAAGMDIADRVFIINGSAETNESDSIWSTVLRHHHKKARLIILLPQSIMGNEDLIADLGANTEIYCRDVPTYLHVLRTRSSARAFLGHDMAFSIDFHALREKYTADAESLIKTRIPVAPHYELAKIMTSRFFFRDNERSKRIRPPSNLDLSVLFKTGTLPGEAEIASTALLTYLDRITEIHTDQIHIAIIGGILGKRALLYNNASGENAAVYEHSIHQNFPDTQLIH